MTPEHIAALTAAVKLIELLSGWHFGAVVLFIITLIIIGPWIAQAINSARQNKQFEAMVTMYKNNATLTEQNEKLTKSYEEHLGEFKDIVMMNTQAFTQLTAAVNQNQFCPLVRLEKKGKALIDS